MGHKVHPTGFRLGISKTWQAKWFAPVKEYRQLLHEDVQMRRLLMGRLKNAGISRIETERSANQLTVIVYTAKPGIVIGKGGASVDQLRDELEKISGKKVRVTIQEIKRPELDAKLVAENVAGQLEKRIAFRRAIKQAILRTMRSGAQGVKVRVKGRLGGSEMARVEWDREGRVPLHTLRANIDFGQTEANTTFGRIGVSVWIFDREQPVAPARVEEARAEEVAPEPVRPEATAATVTMPAPVAVEAVVVPAPAEAARPVSAPAAPAVAPRSPRTRARKEAPAEGTATPPTRRKRTPKAEATAAAETKKTPRARAAGKSEGTTAAGSARRPRQRSTPKEDA